MIWISHQERPNPNLKNIHPLPKVIMEEEEDMVEVEQLTTVVLLAVRQEVIVEQKHKRLLDNLKENGAAIVAVVDSVESVTERGGYIA